MVPKAAIEKAIEGGWVTRLGEIHEGKFSFDTSWSIESISFNPKNGNSIQTLESSIAIAEIVLDPSFWQALGKALGWRDDKQNVGPYKRVTDDWYHHALRFYDLILTGQPTDAYWNELLK